MSTPLRPIPSASTTPRDTSDTDAFVSLLDATILAHRSAPTIRRWSRRGLVRTRATPLGTLYHADDLRRLAAGRGEAAQ
jgi:hypothetical protein